MPLGNAKGQRLSPLPRDILVKAGNQRSSADGANELARDDLGLDGHAEVKPQLQ